MNEKQYLDIDRYLVHELSARPQSKLSEYTYLYTVVAKPQSRSKIYLEHACGRIIHIERTDIKKEKNYTRRCMCESHTAGITFNDACSSKGISGWTSNCRGAILGCQNKTYTFTHECGHSTTKTLKSFWRNHRCYQCNPSDKSSHYSNYSHYVDVNGERFPDWKVDFQKVGDSTVIHSCGYSKTVDLNRFSGLCPICDSVSAGEKMVAQLLAGNNLEFIREFRIPNTNYRLDFYLPQHNLVIEYDGAQHYRDVAYFNYHNTDKIKSQWCENNNLSMLRIPYSANTHLKVLRYLQSKLPTLKLIVAHQPVRSEKIDQELLSESAFRRLYGYSKATSKLKPKVLDIIRSEHKYLLRCHKHHISPSRLVALLEVFGFDTPSYLQDISIASRQYTNIVRYNLSGYYPVSMWAEIAEFYNQHSFDKTLAEYPYSRGQLKLIYKACFGHYKSSRRKETSNDRKN